MIEDSSLVMMSTMNNAFIGVDILVGLYRNFCRSFETFGLPPGADCFRVFRYLFALYFIYSLAGEL